MPRAQRLIYDNYNALVIGFCATDRASSGILSVAVYPRWVNLFFFVGPDLPDPHHLLEGQGSTVRRVRLTAPSDVDDRVTELLDAAIDMWPWSFDADRPITTTIAAVSEKRRPRR